MAQGLPWREGDNLVVDDQEHPSNALPWLSLRRRGVDVRVASSGGHRYTVDDIWARVDGARGWSRCPAQYATACAATSRSWALRRRGIWLVVDGIQGAGSLRARGSTTGAWTRSPAARTRAPLGPLGVGFLHLSPALLDALDPPYLGPSGGLWLDKSGPGWRVAAPDRQDARRLETGNLNYPGIAGWAGAGPDRAGRPGAHRALGVGAVARAGRRPARLRA